MSKRTSRNLKKETRNFWIFSFLTVCSLLAGVVLQFNGYIHQNSLLADTKKQVAALSTQNDDYEANLSQSNSLDNFNQYIAAQSGNYEKVDVASVRYVHAESSQLAKR